MDNWGVVLVIVTLVGLGAAIIRPIVSLTNSITTLTVAVESLKEDMREYRDKNSDSHVRLWRHNEKQDERIEDHEKRIIKMEGK